MNPPPPQIENTKSTSDNPTTTPSKNPACSLDLEPMIDCVESRPLLQQKAIQTEPLAPPVLKTLVLSLSYQIYHIIHKTFALMN